MSDNKQTVGFLERVPLFQGLTARQLEPIARRMVERSFPAGATIVTQGTGGEGFFVVVSGKAEAIRERADGTKAVVNTFGAYDFFGELALLDEGLRTASVVALRASVVLRTPRAELQPTMTAEPAFFDAVTRTVAAAQRALVDRIDALADGDAEARLARLFDGLASRYGTTIGDAPFVALPLRRDEIASMIGVTTETASRITARWTRERRLRATRDGILWRKALS